jgi:hypothetical protein
VTDDLMVSLRGRKGSAKARVTIERASHNAWMLAQDEYGKFEHRPVEAGDTVYVVEIPEPYATLCRPKRVWCASHGAAVFWAHGCMSALLRMV